jgi:PPOX class probable F420-dependent enzyme
MPPLPVREDLLPLLAGGALGHLATISPAGLPQVNPVWFLWENDRLLFSVKPETVKYRNLRANPRVAMSILDPADNYRYLELRGEVIDFTLFTDLTFVNRLAQKYTGADFRSGVAGEERYRITIRVETWTGQ